MNFKQLINFLDSGLKMQGNKRGVASIKGFLLLFVSIAIIGGLIATGNFFGYLNTTAMTTAGAPTWMRSDITITIVGAILLFFFIRKM